VRSMKGLAWAREKRSAAHRKAKKPVGEQPEVRGRGDSSRPEQVAVESAQNTTTGQRPETAGVWQSEARQEGAAKDKASRGPWRVRQAAWEAAHG